MFVVSLFPFRRGGNPRGPAPGPYPPHPLDALADATSAFPSWRAFVAAMAGGYTPTVYPNTRRKRLLRRAVVAAGYRVWPAAGKAVRRG